MKKLKTIPKRVKIKVTKANIKKGRVGSATSCPIALAVRETLGDSPSVYTGGSIRVTINGERVVYNGPKKMADFIFNFDYQLKKVKPFSFVAVREK